MVDTNIIVSVAIPVITLGIGYGIKALKDSGKLPAIQQNMDDIGAIVECINDTVKTFNLALKDGNIDGNEVEVIVGKLNALGTALSKLIR